MWNTNINKTETQQYKIKMENNPQKGNIDLGVANLNWPRDLGLISLNYKHCYSPIAKK